MTYEEALDFLYRQLPMFQRIGAAAFKKDLTNTLKLCEALGNPQDTFPTIHIAGTNGKGSTAHSLAAVLQSAGYKTGLYTSPHLKEYTERIRINGKNMPGESVARFVEKYRGLLEEVRPSFFEMSVVMAFEYFARQEVDVAVIEVGMGGRLDSTNVITPRLSVITSIGKDHQQFLGETLPEIAGEKAGIIKPAVPVVAGHNPPEVLEVIREKAARSNAPCHVAADTYHVQPHDETNTQGILFRVFKENKLWEEKLVFSLMGWYQRYNLPAILMSIDLLRNQCQFDRISDNDVKKGLESVQELTGLKGRWQILRTSPFVVCDTGHNHDGIAQVMKQLAHIPRRTLRIVLGTVADKDLNDIFPLFPKEAIYYFCAANVPRALAAEELKQAAASHQLIGKAYASVSEAVKTARDEAAEEDLIFIGGSTFVVAELDEI
ncbi:folylpolyglutamate synthase/dihydrofolate synthase family protein [Roseivirga sp. BDSF3-8]|uniref:bifunctional folylpolyglutamate synthase/dihydrofolate synthase n=1 Tax=Roseivirga sp. BDSF3-8 TaxID=3241598 RepID=UPI003531DD0E